MRPVIRRLGLSVATVVVLFFLGAACALIALNHDFGRRWASRLIAYATAGEVQVSGISGRFPDRLVLGDVRIAEPQGLNLAISGLALDWSPAELLRGLLRINLLSARPFSRIARAGGDCRTCGRSAGSGAGNCRNFRLLRGAGKPSHRLADGR